MKFYRSRRTFQILFFTAFIILLTLTYRPLADSYHSVFLLSDPLVALLALFHGLIRWEFLGALLVVVLTLLLGRAFCGYICPLGFILDLLSPRKPKYSTDKVSYFSRAPLLILAVFIIFSFLGSSFFFIFDPIVLLTRSTVTLIYPLLDKIIRTSGDFLYSVESLRPYVDAATNVSSGIFIFEQPLRYQLQILILALVLTVVVLSFLQRRFWCRYICPLGALLGLIGRVSLSGRKVSKEKCITCEKCIKACPLGAVRESGLVTDKSICQLCFDCAEVCPTQAIDYGILFQSESYDPSRRAFIWAIASSSAYGLMVGSSSAKEKPRPELIRPPGAGKEKDILRRCARCGQCIKVCPTNVIQPSLIQAGWEGLFTPELDFNNSYCDWSCNSCGKVCPTGAIANLALEKKRKVVIGQAFIYRDRCLPWSSFENCIVCQELCPIPDKAVVLKEDKVVTPEGESVKLKRPFVVSERCIGCGICQYRCPVSNKPAIEVYGVKSRF